MGVCWGGGVDREDQNEMRKSVPTLTPILLGSPLLNDAQSALWLYNLDALKSMFSQQGQNCISDTLNVMHYVSFSLSAYVSLICKTPVLLCYWLNLTRLPLHDRISKTEISQE